MMLDHTMIRYFPWNASNFMILSRGFTDRKLFRLCMMPKLLQLLFALVVQITVLSSKDSKVFSSGTDSTSFCLVMLYLTASVVTILIFTIANLVRLKLEDSSVDVKPSGVDDQNPLYSIDGPDKRMQLVALQSNVESTLSDDVARIRNLEEQQSLLTCKLQEVNMELRNEISELKKQMGCGKEN